MYPGQMTGKSAAFGRLCVETRESRFNFDHDPTAAFGRLCVETDLS